MRSSTASFQLGWTRVLQPPREERRRFEDAAALQLLDQAHMLQRDLAGEERAQVAAAAKIVENGGQPPEIGGVLDEAAAAVDAHGRVERHLRGDLCLGADQPVGVEELRTVRQRGARQHAGRQQAQPSAR